MKHILIRTYQQLILLFLLTAINSANAEIIQLDKTQFRESFTKNVNISGSVRTGVMYSSSMPYVKPDSLYIDIGPQINQLLCVKILSIDGQYGADFTYQIPNGLVGRSQFKLPTDFMNTITSYKPDELAVLAEIKPICKGRNGYIVPASWGLPVLEALKIYLNSGVRSTSLKLDVIKGRSEKLACRPVKSERSTAYDTECVIEKFNKYNLQKTKILRSNFGSHSRAVKLKINISQTKP